MAALGSLPSALSLAARVVEKVPFFSDAEEGFTSALGKLLQPMVCGPGEMIIGEGATAMVSLPKRKGIKKSILEERAERPPKGA